MWIIFSFITAIFSTLFSLSTKKTEEEVDTYSYTSYLMLFSTIFAILFNIYSKGSFIPNRYSIIAGIAQGVTVIFLNKSLELVYNPGLSMGLFRSQAMLTAIISYFVFKSNFNLYTAIGIFMVICGVFLTAYKSEKEKVESFSVNNYRWVLYAVIAGIAITIKDIFTKIAISKSKMQLSTFLMSQLGFAALLSFAYQIYKLKKIGIVLKKKKRVLNHIYTFYFQLLFVYYTLELLPMRRLFHPIQDTRKQ